MPPARAVNIGDLRKMARLRLPRVIFDYLEGGAEDESTLRLNRTSFEAYRLVPRILGGGLASLKTEMFGQQFAAPFMVAPTGLNGIFWKDGDLHLARAASEAGVGFVLSAASNRTIEEVAEATDGPKWFQLYPWGRPELAARLVERATKAGYGALVITVDSLVPGKRERDLRNGFAHHPSLSPRVVADGLLHPRWLFSVWLRGGMPRMENLVEFLPPQASARQLAEFTRQQRNPHFSWDDVARLRRLWDGPMILKGVMCPKDALRAAREGLDGIVVSNHGGRQLDGAAATLDVLPEIADAVAGRVKLLIDSGFRRGADVAKALALGADMVLLGRAPLYGLAGGGPAGAARALEIFREELERTMLLLGCPDVGALSPQWLSKQHELGKNDRKREEAS